MQYVGAGRRFVAAILDGIILGVLNFLVGSLLGTSSGYTVSGANAANPAAFAVSIILSVGYSVGYQGYAGQTLGKKVMAIRVVDQKGQKPSYFTFFLRETIGKVVSAIILFIGYLMILWDSKKQGLHDKIASTYVVRA